MVTDAVISSAMAFALLFAVMILLALCVNSLKAINAFERRAKRKEAVEDEGEAVSPPTTIAEPETEPAAEVKETESLPQVIDTERAVRPEVVAAISGAVQICLEEDPGIGRSQLIDAEGFVRPEIVAAISGAVQIYLAEDCADH